MQNEITGVQNESCKTLRTMTFNLFHHDQSDDHVERVRILLKENKPDTVGFQEITQTWIDEKLMTDPEIASLYAFVGKDRGDSTHEQTAIFYRKDKFDLKDSGTKWLYGEEGSIGSDTVGGLVTQEEREAAGQKCYYRCYTYVRLARKSDGQQFVFANTHLELASYKSDSYPNKGDVQNKQIDYILNFAKQMQDQGYPVILTGDFNAQRGSTVCNKIDALGFVLSEDATTKLTGAEPTENDKFFNGKSGESKKINSNIDHIYVLAESCYFDSYRICNETFADSQGVMGFPSDHLPRVAVFAIG